MRVSLAAAKKTLALIWFFGAAPLFCVVLIQTISGHYGDRYQDAWGWLLPSVLPTLSLMIAAFVKDSDRSAAGSVSQFIYRLTVVLSIGYLVTVMVTIFASPFAGTTVTPDGKEMAMTDLQAMQMSHIWLGPFQGLVTAALGAFFVDQQKSGAEMALRKRPRYRVRRFPDRQPAPVRTAIPGRAGHALRGRGSRRP